MTGNLAIGAGAKQRVIETKRFNPINKIKPSFLLVDFQKFLVYEKTG